MANQKTTAEPSKEATSTTATKEPSVEAPRSEKSLPRQVRRQAGKSKGASAPGASTARKRGASRKVPAKRAEAEPAPGAAVGPKGHKARHKLVRDSFTMPDADFALIAELKKRLLGKARAAKKSELLRAGLHALSALGDDALTVAFDQLERIKTGRPKKGH